MTDSGVTLPGRRSVLQGGVKAWAAAVLFVAVRRGVRPIPET